MISTKLSSKGQVIIPKTIRSGHHWETGQEFIVINQKDNIILKPKAPFPETSLDDVEGFLKHNGNPLSLEDMDKAIQTGIERHYK